MRSNLAPWIAAVLVVAAFAVAFWTWLLLPAGAGIAISYLDLDGVRHPNAPRAVVWVIPVVSALVALALARRVRRLPGADAAALPLDATLIGTPGVLLAAELAMTGRAIDPGFNAMGPAAIATGVLLAAVGNYLGKARRNAAFGIRTPWTLAEAGVWDRTHRFTGLLMVLGGAALVVLGFALRDGRALGLAIAACSAGPVLAGIARSASLARHRPSQGA